MTQENILPNNGKYTKDGERYMNGSCLLKVHIELEPHGSCSGGIGTLVVPIQGGNTIHEAAFRCSECNHLIFHVVSGTCF